jgi:hypothetical protein
MTARHILLCAPLCLFATSVHSAHVAATYEFERDLDGWRALSTPVRGEEEGQPVPGLSVTHEPENVRSGEGALQFEYTAERGMFKPLVLGQVDLREAQSLRFWVKASHAIPLALVVTERGGPSYGLLVMLSENAWQHVQVNLADLGPADGQPDANGKLDLDEVNGIALFDATPGLALEAEADPQSAQALGLELASGSLWVDRFEVSAEPVATLHPRRQTDQGQEVTIDSFESGLLTWIPLGAPKVSFVPADEGTCLQLEYQPRPFSGIARAMIPVLGGPETYALRLKARSDAPVSLGIGFGELDGSRYEAQLSLAPTDDWQTFELGLLGFGLAQGSEDENGQLDPGQVKSIYIMDASGFAGEVQRRKLWLDDIVFLSAP